MNCLLIFPTHFDKLNLPTSGGCITPCALRPQARNRQGRMKARRAKVRSCQRSGWGWEGNTAMRFPGLVLPRKMNKTKKQPQKPGKQRFPDCKTCAPQTVQNAHTATVWKIRENRRIYYGIAETSKVLMKQERQQEQGIEEWGNGKTVAICTVIPTARPGRGKISTQGTCRNSGKRKNPSCLTWKTISGLAET